MSTDPKSGTPPVGSAATIHHNGIKIFTYPKIIFIWPTMVTAFLCGIGMLVIQDNTVDPTKGRAPRTVAQTVKTDAKSTTVEKTTTVAKTDKTDAADTTTGTTTVAPKRFSSPQNVMGMIFMLVLGLNLLIMSIDFPRFTIIALILLVAATGFFILWLNVYFNLLPPLVRLLEGIFAVANAGFYLLMATVMLINFGIIYVTRYLDYWEILPNELLHNHGPFSDLERYPTFNLKFAKEIPYILEYILLRSGRLVLHLTNERKAIVLDNVLWIDAKEEELKRLMSRMEVRVTTDQETAEPSL
jgi:hypothetical protein